MAPVCWPLKELTIQLIPPTGGVSLPEGLSGQNSEGPLESFKY